MCLPPSCNTTFPIQEVQTKHYLINYGPWTLSLSLTHSFIQWGNNAVVSTWNSHDSANLPSSAYVLIISFPLQGRELFYSSPLPSLLRNITPPAPSPKCARGAICGQRKEGWRKGRQGNGILLFVMGQGDMITSHWTVTVHSVLESYTNDCTYTNNNC